MTNTVMDFKRKAPCAKCPFRSDIETYLRPERAAEIADALRRGSEFSCHETTVPSADGEDLVRGPGNRFCAGALATLERGGESNQLTRIAERLGVYEPEKLKADEQPVYDSLTEWVRAHYDIPTVIDSDGTVREYEHCGVVADDCEDPAGYGGFGGGSFENADEPTCNPLEDECWSCGHTACVSCRSEQWDKDNGQYCVYCGDDEDDEVDE
jgi:hypothetical protein